MTEPMPSILLVDDEEDICAVMADILADQGYHVDVAYEGRAALELVQRRPYDVALLDYKMPGMDGLTLYREIRKLRTGTVAVVVTAYAGTSMAEEAITAGAWQVMTKPVDVPRLLRVIGEVLEQPLVLVVDDDADFCDTLWDLLRERGYRVCIAHDAREAAERLRETTRVVLVDLVLPDRDGAEICRQVHEAYPAARVVIVTGHPSALESKVEQLAADGVDAICYKPLDVPGLLGTLKHLADDSRETAGRFVRMTGDAERPPPENPPRRGQCRHAGEPA